MQRDTPERMIEAARLFFDSSALEHRVKASLWVDSGKAHGSPALPDSLVLKGRGGAPTVERCRSASHTA